MMRVSPRLCAASICVRNSQSKATALVSSGNRVSFARRPGSVPDYKSANFYSRPLLHLNRGNFSLSRRVLLGESAHQQEVT